jgi:hypothetical protein
MFALWPDAREAPVPHRGDGAAYSLRYLGLREKPVHV